MLERKAKVLAADDDLNILNLIAFNLELEGYEVYKASDGARALELVKTEQPDAIILDVMMPAMDGFAVCERVREFSATPIIIATAMDAENDKIRGLDLGADDYLVKPFSIPELFARVRAVIRRSRFSNVSAAPLPATPTVERLGEITIDHALHTVTHKGREVALTPIEFALLATLMREAGNLIRSETLLETVWGSEYSGETHILQVNVHRLRRKIEDDPSHPVYIKTQPGLGYYMPRLPANVLA